MTRETFRITSQGRGTLTGDLDHVRTNGIDRWMGGVHLSSGGPVWCWNEASKKLVRDQ